ncbi:MAG: hypothetical protein L3J09_11095 [Flavobacteriaceae bacterium]|nr:hypothetical protein [Flavobacteriaceae bacterium]
MKKIILLIIFLSYYPLQAQNRTEIAAYNIGIGAIGSGIGAVINKKKDEKIGEVLLKGIWQGAIGGYLVYESKNILSKIPEQKTWEYSWAAKMVNSAGTSIIENAASNRDFWEVWHINIGFNRIEFHTKDKFEVKYRIMPVSLVLSIGVALNTKFEFKRTLQTGELIFSKKNLINHPQGGALGVSIGNLLIMDSNNLNNYTAFTHELIHIYQYYDYNFINAFLNKPLSHWSKNSNTFNILNNIFYFDIQEPFIYALYKLENNRDCYYNNFFEYEARFFSRGDIINCE